MSVYYEVARYKVRIVSAALGESKEKATPQVELGIEILGAYQDGGHFVEFSGPSRTVFLPLTEKCLGTPNEPEWVTQTLVDLGFVGPSFADLDPLIGKERDGQCKHDDFNGQTNEKWGIFRQSRTPQKPAEQKTVRALDSKHKDLLRSFAKVGANRQANAPPPRAPARPAKPASNGQPLPATHGLPSVDEFDAPPASNDDSSSIPF